MSQKTLLRHAEKQASAVAPKSNFRRDIQGLRAVAVLAVVADHLFKWPSGGFVGVDVFFVISGFLITGLLLKEHDRTGTISFTGFYKRRARRILPASIVTLAVTVAVTYLVFNVGRAQQVMFDGLWAAAFSANWRFAATGTDYFQASSPVSPLQHFWSLAVEEQFYFVWPWVMLLVFAVGARSLGWDTKRAHKAVGLAMAAIIIVSFSWALIESVGNPAVAYFSTFSRAWELGVGALLAAGAGLLARLPRSLRPILAYAGLAGIGWSIFNVSAAVAFPAPWAAVPVLATALVIAAGAGSEEESPWLWPLTNPVGVYVGTISFSLYLMHFPVIVVLASVVRPESPFYVPAAIALMAALSIGMYHLVEKPVLKSSWLSDSPRRPKAPASSIKPKLIGLTVLAAVTACVTATAVAEPAILHPVPVSAAPKAATPLAATAAAPASALDTQVDAVRAGLTASTWPEFSPSIDNLAALRAPQWTKNGCLNVTDDNVDLCVYGAARTAKTAVVMGDSIATSWLPGIIAALEPLGYRIHALTYESCPNAHLDVFPNAQIRTPYTECREHQAWAEDRVTELLPDLVIMSNSSQSVDRLVSGMAGEKAVSEWVPAYRSTLAALPQEAKVVTLAPAPGAVNLQACYTPISRPADCIGTISPSWRALRVAEQEASAEATAAYIDTENWFCSGGSCPAVTGTTAIFTDSSHLTRTYSEQLSPLILETFKAMQLVS